MGRWEATRAMKEAAAVESDPTEAQMLRALTEAARAGGWLYHHTQRSDYGRQMGLRGFPDLILVKDTEIVALEIKARRGVVTPEQFKWLTALQWSGATAEVVYPPDLAGWVKRLNDG